MSAVAIGDAPVWQTVAGSSRGASHERSGLPNQDFGRTAVIDNGVGAVIAVADGHGDPMHARSDRGSRFAIEAAFDVLTCWVRLAAGSEAGIRSSADRLPAAILDGWRRKVAADLDGDTPREDETGSLTPEKLAFIRRSPEVLYGSTLVAAAINDRFVAYVQIGDGDLLVVDPDDVVSRALPGNGDLPTNRTESLCQEDAGKRFRVAVEFHCGKSRPQLVLASTDGYSNSYPSDEAAFLKVAEDIKRYLERNGTAWVQQHVESWLQQTSEAGSGDDITLSLAWIGPKVPPELRSKPRRRRWRRLAIVALAAAISVSAFSAGLFWMPESWKTQVLELARVATERVIKIVNFSQQGTAAQRPDGGSDPKR